MHTTPQPSPATPPRLALSRRQLLGAALLVPGAWVLGQLWGRRPLPDMASPCLGSGPRQTLEAAFGVFLPTAADARAAAADVDAFLSTHDPRPAAELRQGLRALEWLGGVGLLGFRSFSRLDPDERAAVLDAWGGSRWGLKRQVYQGLRRTAFFAHYARPDTWPAIGYEGPWPR